MRVVHLDTGREWRGGQTQLRLLVRGTPDVVILPPGAPLRDALVSDGAQVETVPMRGPVWGNGALRRTLRRLGPDLVAAHTSQAHAQALLAGLAPVVVHRRNDFRPGLLSGPKYRAAHGYVAVSQAVREVLVHTGVAPDRIRVVHDGVDLVRLDRAQPDPRGVRRELGCGPDARLVLAVGALVDHKGHRHLLDAMAHLPGWHLVILGEGPLREELTRQRERLGLVERVHLLGQRPDVPRWLRSVDVVAHPSVEEGLGSSVLEALICGAPVVASRVGGLPEVVEGHGKLVPPGSPPLLAEAVRTAGPATDLSPLRRQFSADRMAASTRMAYEELLQTERA